MNRARQPRLAIVATHPIQYQAPLFRRLTAGGVLDIHVFYGWEGAAERPVFDRGFGRAVQWDIPLLEGYDHTFVRNRAQDPGTHHFGGLDNPELVPRVLAWEPDAVLVFGWSFRSHLQTLRSLHGRVPLFFRGDSTLIGERRGLRRSLRRLWLRWVYRNVDVALYVGTRNRAYFLAHGLGDHQLHWAPQAIDNKRFADPDGGHGSAARAWRLRLGIPEDGVVILFAGKLDATKAPDLLLDAFLALNAPEGHLVIAGSGALEGALRSRSGGHPRVHFLGFQNQSRMPSTYRLADVFVLASRGTETWGLAVNEAMAGGLPVVVSDQVGCAPDLVVEGENGYVVRAGEVGALRLALEAVLGDYTCRTRMGRASSRIIEGWNMDRQAESIEAAILESLESRCPAPLLVRS